MCVCVHLCACMRVSECVCVRVCVCACVRVLLNFLACCWMVRVCAWPILPGHVITIVAGTCHRECFCNNSSKTISLLLLHASTTLICLRASRSLLRQVFFRGSGRVFFRSCFRLRFLTSFRSILEGFCKRKSTPKSSFGMSFWMSFLMLHFSSIFS